MPLSTIRTIKIKSTASFLVTAFFGLGALAQQFQNGPAAAIPGGDYSVAEIGPHSRLWVNASGQSITEIATGMNYWDGRTWSPSEPEFQVAADGSGFAIDKVQDPTHLAANLNSYGAVTVTTPDGVTLRSTPLAIGLYDTASGQSVIVATLTNSIGVLADPQDVVYDRAFVGGGFAATVVYSRPDAGTFEQDVVFVGFDPDFDPTKWGFAAASTNTLEVQIFTEFYNPPEPTAIMRPLYVEQDAGKRVSMASPDFVDYTLDFGDYVFGPGRAYAIATNDTFASGVTVAKEFVTSQGRSFLVESTPYRALEGGLRSLPPVQRETSMLKRPEKASRRRLAAASVPPILDLSKTPIGHLAFAKSASPAVGKPHGVLIDYIVTVSSTSVPTVYSSDTTYYVSGTVVNSSAVTMESAVFKYPTNNAGIIEISGSLALATTNYRPAIFTAADDNTAGTPFSTAVWSNYTGNPSGKYYGNVALWLNTTANLTLNNLRFCYARMALEISADAASQTVALAHSQLVDCINGVYVNGGNGSGSGGSDSITLQANNCLMAHVSYPIQAVTISIGGSATACTIDSSTYIFQFDSSTTGSFAAVNSLFSSNSSQGVLNLVSLSGNHNGFFHSTAFGTSQTSASLYPYENAWAGNYYVPPSSQFYVSGSSVGGTLLAQLQAKTTQAPLILTNFFTTSTNLQPAISRDTNGLLLGFHYDPIDYFAACAVSNAVLGLTNGVAMAYYDNLGILLEDGASLLSQGTPIQRNYLVYYGQVQEEPTNVWGISNGITQALPIVALPFGSSSNPIVSLRLTTIAAPTGQTNLLNTRDSSGTLNSNQVLSALTMRDCEVYGAGASWLMNESNNAPAVSLINNVFYRVPFAVNSQAQVQSFNNLFYGTTNVSTNLTAISIHHRTGGSPNTNENDIFDGVSVSLDGVVGYNGYIHGATNTSYTNNNDIWTNISWAGGPLGSFYQTTNGPFLRNGSVVAGVLGLYHYTVLTNNVIEGTNLVSRGYAYVALGTNGLPLVTNPFGVPDYEADSNGDGVTELGELPFGITIDDPINGSVYY